MAIGALMTNFSSGTFYTGAFKSKKTGSDSTFDTAVSRVADESEDTKDSAMSHNVISSVPYTRCITANIKTQEMVATSSEHGDILYSYNTSEQQFQIFINSDGKDKTYSIHGIDENGNEFVRDFNPYETDPEYADFPEFSALCLYIQNTDETADLLANDYFNSGDIFEKKNYLEMLENFGTDNESTQGRYLLECAMSLVHSLHDLMAQRMRLSDTVDEAQIEKILMDNNVSDNEDEKFIHESVTTRHTEYTDPDTHTKVPVDIRYTTSYSENGITCSEATDVGGKSSERELWSIAYNSPQESEKVQDFLRSFSDDERLTFATQQNFWNDFLNDDFDVSAFRAFYDTTDNGRIDIEKAQADGKTLRDTLTEPDAKYFNNQSFIGHVWTEQEMWDNWYARIDASQRASRANGTGMEPPTETITVTNYTARSYRDKAFHYIGSNAPNSVRQAWLDAADEIGIDGQGITDIGTLDHIPQFMIQRFIRQYNGYDVDDILGSTVGSAIRAAQDAIYSLDHPLEPNRMRSAEVLRAREQERAFYERFIEKLRIL